MAGSSLALVVQREDHAQKAVVSPIRDQWQISYARFFVHPLLPSTHPSLVPRPNDRRHRHVRGSWISSGSPTALLKLHNYHASPEAILCVTFLEKIMEEHYVPQLQFYWPQMACVPDCPPRGSRTVFVSYRDSVGEIQKFALRFPTLSEADTFIHALKEILKDSTESETESLTSDFGFENSSQSVLMSTNRSPSRFAGSACVEEQSIMNPIQTCPPDRPLLTSNHEVDEVVGLKEQSLMAPVGTCSPEPQLLPNHEVEQQSSTREMIANNNYELALPPSFSSFFADCCSKVEQAMVQSSIPEETDLKSQIARYMEDSSFQDLLLKVEKVIGEMGAPRKAGPTISRFRAVPIGPNTGPQAAGSWGATIGLFRMSLQNLCTLKDTDQWEIKHDRLKP